MILGKSELHIFQPENINCYCNDWYYPNDLSSKLLSNGVIDSDGIRVNFTLNGDRFYFPIALAQRALAMYDRYLKTGTDLTSFNKLVEWFINNQDENGGWDCWSISNKGTKVNYSAMAQGQVISVLVRSYKDNKDPALLFAIEKAYSLLVSETLCYKDNNIVLFDETPYDERNIILNGHIFSLWGVYDYNRLFNSEHSSRILNLAIRGTLKLLSDSKIKWWSLYDQKGSLASPFYHNLHIAQLSAMYKMFGCNDFLVYKNNYISYKKNKFFVFIAIVMKLIQKLKQKQYNEFVS